MPIFLLDSSFEEVQDWSKDHFDQMSRTCILNLFHMCKVGQIYPTCIRDVSHTPTDDYILERLGVHFTHILEVFSSLTNGVSFRDSHGDAVRASWCSVLMKHFYEQSWGCVTHWVGWPYEVFVGWSISLITVTPPFFISVLACLPSIYWYALSTLSLSPRIF